MTLLGPFITQNMNPGFIVLDNGQPISHLPDAQKGKKRALAPRHCSYNGCEPPHEYWELIPGPLQEQPVPLSTEPPLQPKKKFLKTIFIVTTASFILFL